MAWKCQHVGEWFNDFFCFPARQSLRTALFSMNCGIWSSVRMSTCCLSFVWNLFALVCRSAENLSYRLVAQAPHSSRFRTELYRAMYALFWQWRDPDRICAQLMP